MIDLALRTVGVFRKGEASTQTILTPWICFMVSGWDRMLFRMTDGSVLDLPRDEPCMLLLMPDTFVEYAFTARRENWVVHLETKGLRTSDRPGSVDIAHEGQWLPIPMRRVVPRQDVPGWQAEFNRLRTAFHAPLPQNRLYAQICVLNILRFMLGQVHDALAESPAAMLKRLIDDDTLHLHSIAELGKRCGYSTDHLRILFKQEYQISPREYRRQQQLARVMDLVSNSRLTVKEIAQQTGFEYVSHLSATFRKAFGMTVREGIRRFRHSS